MGLTSYNLTTAIPGWVYPTAFSINDSPVFLETSNCLVPDCPDLVESQLHPREIKALKEFSSVNVSFYEPYFSNIKKDQEYLRLRKDDPRDKFLFLSAEESHNGALDPEHVSKLLNDINKDFDIRYKVIKTYDEICQEIEQAAKVGKLAHVLIHGHGNPDGVCISKCDTLDGWIHENREFANCFSGLDPSGTIILLDPKAKASDYKRYYPQET